MTEKRFSYEIEKFKEELGQYNRSGLVKLLLEMKEENEQLKKRIQSIHTMLDNAILLERTRMGKNCLKQFKETIE